MKRKLTALLLSAAMIASMIPAVGAASPSDFEAMVSMPLMAARTSGLYDEPEMPLPDVEQSGFMREIEGWTPTELGEGLPVAVGEVAVGAVEISTAEQLQAMTAGSYVLTADIDLTGVAWTPLTINGGLVLDGQGHTIRGLNVTSQTTAVSGLIGRVEGDLTVQNLCWEDITLTVDCAASTGEVFARGTLASAVRGNAVLRNVAARNVAVTRANTQGKSLGGIIGQAASLTAEDCFFDIAVQRDATWIGTVESGCDTIGGVLGTGSCMAARCYLKVNLDSENASDATVGGLVGSGNLSVKDCLVTGTLNSDGSHAGGLSGYSSGSTYNSIYPVIENCVVQAALTSKYAAGGMIGRTNKAEVTISDSRYIGTITMEEGGTASIGGMIGFLRGSLNAEGCAADVKLTSENASQSAPTLNGRVGGMIGHTEGAAYTLNRCVAHVSDEGIHTADMAVGGLVGSYQYAGDGIIEDSFAKLEMPEFQLVSGNLTVGGLVGNANGIVATNSGANLNLSVENTVRTGDGVFGGLIGYVASSAQIARSYASGSVDAVWAGDVNESLDAGGLVGSCYTHVPISIGQCYGGVDIRALFRDGVDACSVGGLIGNGENCMIYSSWSDAEVRADVPEGAERRNGKGHLGGLVGYGRGTMMDSCFVGTIPSVVMGYAGGLAGQGPTALSNCYAQVDLPGGGATGGLVGAAGTVRYTDCRYEGSITDAWGTTGGILGAGDGTIVRCTASGEISAPNQVIGGIAGDFGGTITDCEFSGSVAGCVVGGIAGSANTVEHCDVWGSVSIATGESVANCELGGIVGKGRWIDDCHVKNRLYVDFCMPGTSGHYQDMGGIAGATDRAFGRGAVTNSSSRGISVHVTESDINLNLGGIVGEAGDEMDFENCRVTGSVSATNPIGYIYVGGIAGQGYDSNVKNCTVSGGVSGYISDGEKGQGPIFTGGIYGWGSWGVILDGVSCGSGSGSAANPNVQIRKDSPEIGVGAVNKEYVPAVDSSSKEGETHTVRVYWHPEMSLSMLPLAGAEVSIDGGVVGTTGADGALVLDSDAMSRQIVRISAELEGYFGSEVVTYLTKGGTTNLYLEKKTPGKIYLRSALIYDEEEQGVELLYSNNSVNVLLNEPYPRRFFFGVDWNDTQEDERKLQLLDKDGNVRASLIANTDIAFYLQTFFDPEEEVYLRASGLKEDGSETATQVLLPLKVKMFTPVAPVVTEEIPMGDNNGKRGIDALAGVKIGLNFDNLFGGVGKLTYENHVLTAEFGGKPLELSGSTLLGMQPKVGIKGVVSATDADKGTPISEMQWSGGVHVFAELDPVLAYAPVSVPGKPPFPFTFYTEVECGTDFGVDVYGTIKKPRIGGALTLNLEANITAGLGASANRDWMLMIGGRAGGTGKLTGSISVGAEDLTSDAYAEFSAYMDVAVIGKGGEMVDLDAAYQFGKIVWNSNDGATVYALGNEVASVPREDDDEIARSAQWIPATQSYLAGGGGFYTNPMQCVDVLNAWNGGAANGGEQAGMTRLYENIAQGSTAALAVEDGNLVLYFTADDGNREIEGNLVDHTAVWRTVRSVDGNWGEPVIVSGSENGYPDQIQADGPVAVWEESTQTGSLEELMRSTRIQVAVNGEMFHTVETGGYAYNVRVSAADDGSSILVVWFSAPEVCDFESALNAQPSVCYAFYTDGAWRQGTLDTRGEIPVDAIANHETPCIAWKDLEGNGYLSTRSDFSRCEHQLTALAASAGNGTYTAEMENDGRLTIWESGTEVTTIQTGAGGGNAPMMLDDGNGVYYVVWTAADGIYYVDSASGWGRIKRICGLEQQPTQLSAVVVDGRPAVIYYQTQRNQTENGLVRHLYTAQAPDLSGVDLAVTEVTLEETDAAKTGLLTVRAVAENRREEVVTAYTYTVTDENGKSLYSEQVTDVALGLGDTAVCSVLIPADVTQQRTYTVRVTADGDLDSSNDALSAATTAAAALLDTGFMVTPTGKTGLEAVVGNDSAAPMEEMTVEVYRCDADGTRMGDVLVAECFTDVYAGSYRQVVLDEAVMDTLYKVVLTSGGKEVDSRMLMWSDPDVSGVWITGVDLDETGKARVNLSAQNWTENLVFHLAVYQNGRMVANAVENLDAWTGAKSLEFDFAEELSGGEYTCSAFLLKRDGLVPVVEKLTDTVVIP